MGGNREDPIFGTWPFGIYNAPAKDKVKKKKGKGDLVRQKDLFVIQGPEGETLGSSSMPASTGGMYDLSYIDPTQYKSPTWAEGEALEKALMDYWRGISPSKLEEGEYPEGTKVYRVEFTPFGEKIYYDLNGREIKRTTDY